LELRGQSLKFCESNWMPSDVMRGMASARPALDEFKTCFRNDEDDEEDSEGDALFLAVVPALSRTLR
jgi:hypothetical protein